MAEATSSNKGKSSFKSTVEEAGPARKRLTVTVPPDVIADKIQESMGTLASQTSLPGFRKGRAPTALLERRFGSSVRDETKNQVIADGYASAIEEHKLQPVGEPEPVEKLEDLTIEEGKPLVFSLEVEVVPEFELPEFSGLEVKKPLVEITDKHLKAELNRQCRQLGELVKIESDFVVGDRIVGPGTTTREGEDEPFFRHENVDFIIPSGDESRGQVLGLLIDGLADLVKGKKVGDTITIGTIGPAGHEREDVRGKKLIIEIQIREGQRIIPATIERVMEEFAMDSEDILREQLKLALEQRLDQEQRSAMREQVCEYLLEQTDFEVPEKLSANQASRLLDRQRLEMLYRAGMSADEVETRLAEIRGEAEAHSRRRLKLSFLLHRLAEKYEVSVSDQEVNGRIAAIAMQRGERPEKLRNELLQSGAISQIATQIREHKATDRVIDTATITEVDAEEWNRIKEKKAATKETTAKQETTAKKAPAKTASKKTPTKKTTKKKTGKK